jgi:N utilization substance protein B
LAPAVLRAASLLAMRRTDQRRAAIFALYQHDLTGRPLDDVFRRDSRPFTRALAHAVQDHCEELDGVLERHATGWTVDRIAPLERSILRVGLLELLHPELVADPEPIPPEAAIDEAVETAKTFCGSDTPKFVNGILGTVLREREGSPR